MKSTQFSPMSNRHGYETVNFYLVFPHTGYRLAGYCISEAYVHIGSTTEADMNDKQYVF